MDRYMLYKIQGDFDNFEKIIKYISPYFKFLYANETLFIALIDVKKAKEAEVAMKKAFSPIRKFYIKKIDQTNIMQEHDKFINWGKDRLVEMDSQYFELEQQEKLQNAMTIMDNLEKYLQEQQRKEEALGTGKEKKRKTKESN